jgi:hypothetical protein
MSKNSVKHRQIGPAATADCAVAIAAGCLGQFHLADIDNIRQVHIEIGEKMTGAGEFCAPTNLFQLRDQFQTRELQMA